MPRRTGEAGQLSLVFMTGRQAADGSAPVVVRRSSSGLWFGHNPILWALTGSSTVPSPASESRRLVQARRRDGPELALEPRT
jgi:hypothetical protein